MLCWAAKNFYSKFKGIKMIQSMFSGPNKINLKTDKRKIYLILPCPCGLPFHFSAPTTVGFSLFCRRHPPSEPRLDPHSPSTRTTPQAHHIPSKAFWPWPPRWGAQVGGWNGMEGPQEQVMPNYQGNQNSVLSLGLSKSHSPVWKCHQKQFLQQSSRFGVIIIHCFCLHSLYCTLDL